MLISTAHLWSFPSLISHGCDTIAPTKIWPRTDRRADGDDWNWLTAIYNLTRMFNLISSTHTLEEIHVFGISVLQHRGLHPSITTSLTLFAWTDTTRGEWEKNAFFLLEPTSPVILAACNKCGHSAGCQASFWHPSSTSYHSHPSRITSMLTVAMRTNKVPLSEHEKKKKPCGETSLTAEMFTLIMGPKLAFTADFSWVWRLRTWASYIGAFGIVWYMIDFYGFGLEMSSQSVKLVSWI